MDRRSTLRTLAFATTAYVGAWTAHMTLVYALAPAALRASGAEGLDAWVFAATSIAAMLAVLPAGRLADRYPRRRILRAGIALIAAGCGPLALAGPSFASALAGSFLSGAGLVVIVVAFNSYVADLLSGSAMSRAYGNVSAITVLASATGPFVAAAIFRAVADEPLGLRANAAVFLLVALLALLLTFRLPAAQRPAAPLAQGILSVWRSERATVRPIALLYVLLGAGYGLTYPYFAVYFLDALRTPNETWSVLLGLATVASAVGAFAAGRLVRVWSPWRVALLPQAALLVACLAFLAPLPLAILGGAFVARSLLANTVSPTTNALMMGRVDAQARARVQALASLAWNAGWTAGSLAGTAALAALGGAIFPLGAALGLVGVAVGMRMLSR